MSGWVAGFVLRGLEADDSTGLTALCALRCLEYWGFFGVGLMSLARAGALEAVLAMLGRDAATFVAAAAALVECADLGLDDEHVEPLAGPVLA